MKVEKVYSRLNCGGVGYSPTLIRVWEDGRWIYYTISGADEDYGKFSEMSIPSSPKKTKWSLWRRYAYKNIITVEELLKKLEEIK